MKQNDVKDVQIEYLRKQLDQAMRNNRREVQSSYSPSETHSVDKESEDHHFTTSEEDEERRPRRTRRDKQHFMDFKVEIPEFEGRLDPDEFIDWMNTMERMFEYKEVPNDKKVMLVALKLHMYASIWWNNVVSKRARKRKGKIRSWRKMKEKLESKFLPPHDLQDNFTKLHTLKQETKSLEKYTCDFESLMMTCDLRKNEDQTVVRYLARLNDFIRNVAELQHYSTLDEVCSIAYKAELQRKARFNREPPKTPQRTYPFNKGSLPPTRKPTNTPMAPPNPKPNFSKPPLNSFDKRRCYKCQGFGHIASEYHLSGVPSF